MQLIITSLLFFFLLSVNVADALGYTIDFLGVDIPKQIELIQPPREKLELQGYSIHLIDTEPFYVGALFTPKPEKKSEMLLLNDMSMAMIYYFVQENLTPEFVKTKFTEELLINNPDWDKNPVNKQRLMELQTLLDREYKVGDTLAFEYSAGDYLTVVVNGSIKGQWENGRSFYNAILRTWIGAYPPSREFKDAILGK